jgi:hypothetical protein
VVEKNNQGMSWPDFCYGNFFEIDVKGGGREKIFLATHD